MSEHLVIFAGAGASYGVSKDLFPTTVQFRSNLPKKIAENPLFAHLENHINSTQNTQVIDIEHILWELGKFIENLSACTSGGFLSTILNNGLFNGISPGAAQGPHIFNQFNELCRTSERLREEINARVYDHYGHQPPPERLSATWGRLLEVAIKAFPRIDIVTTNYDRIAEAAARQFAAERIDLGFEDPGALEPQIHLEKWKSNARNRGMLTKLHGSIDWVRGRTGTEETPLIRRGIPEFSGRHSDRFIIYPGFKGIPTEEPYLTFHKYLKETLIQAGHIVFVGYAFRDEYINSIFEETLDLSKSIAIIDPAETIPDLVFLKKARHMKGGFGEITLVDSRKMPQSSALEEWILATSL